MFQKNYKEEKWFFFLYEFCLKYPRICIFPTTCLKSGILCLHNFFPASTSMLLKTRSKSLKPQKLILLIARCYCKFYIKKKSLGIFIGFSRSRAPAVEKTAIKPNFFLYHCLDQFLGALLYWEIDNIIFFFATTNMLLKHNLLKHFELTVWKLFASQLSKILLAWGYTTSTK